MNLLLTTLALLPNSPRDLSTLVAFGQKTKCISAFKCIFWYYFPLLTFPLLWHPLRCPAVYLKWLTNKKYLLFFYLIIKELKILAVFVVPGISKLTMEMCWRPWAISFPSAGKSEFLSSSHTYLWCGYEWRIWGLVPGMWSAAWQKLQVGGK